MTDNVTVQKQKPISPLQAMTLNSTNTVGSTSSVKPRTQAHIASSQNNNTTTPLSNQIIAINPQLICNWKFSDRPEQELGNIQHLAEEFKTIGQQMPCIIRPVTSEYNKFKYELIAGERRWRASILAGVQLKAIIKELNDHDAAIIQASENAQRKDLSDYAKGMSYSRLIEQGVITQTDLIKTLSISKVEVSRLLSFRQIPEEIWNAMDDKSKISARTASELRAIANKGDKHIEILVQLAPKIQLGKLGAKSIKLLVEKLLNDDPSKRSSPKVINSRNGRHLFTWRKDSNSNISISFPKDIRNIINKVDLEANIKAAIEKQLILMNSGKNN